MLFYYPDFIVRYLLKKQIKRICSRDNISANIVLNRINLKTYLKFFKKNSVDFLIFILTINKKINIEKFFSTLKNSKNFIDSLIITHLLVHVFWIVLIKQALTTAKIDKDYDSNFIKKLDEIEEIFEFTFEILPVYSLDTSTPKLSIYINFFKTLNCEQNIIFNTIYLILPKNFDSSFSNDSSTQSTRMQLFNSINIQTTASIVFNNNFIIIIPNFDYFEHVRFYFLSRRRMQFANFLSSFCFFIKKN